MNNVCLKEGRDVTVKREEQTNLMSSMNRRDLGFYENDKLYKIRTRVGKVK